MAISLGNLIGTTLSNVASAISNPLSIAVPGFMPIAIGGAMAQTALNVTHQLINDIVPPPATTKTTTTPPQIVPAPFTTALIQNASIPSNSTQFSSVSIPRTSVTTSTFPLMTNQTIGAPLNASSTVLANNPPSNFSPIPIPPRSFSNVQIPVPNDNPIYTVATTTLPQTTSPDTSAVQPISGTMIGQALNTLASQQNKVTPTALTLSQLITGAKTFLPSTSSGLLQDLGLASGALAPEASLLGKALLVGGAVAGGGQILKGAERFLGAKRKKHHRARKMHAFRHTRRRGHLTVHGKHFSSMHHKMSYLRSLRKR